MANSFSSKIIQASFTLASGTFDGENNTTVITGLRSTVEIEKGGHPSKNSATVKINGMSQKDMNLLTTLAFRPLAARKNLIQILAGDSAGLSLVFQGDITEAWASYQSPPDLYFHAKAVTGYYPAIAPAAPKSYRGSTDVSAIMASLASQMGYSFQNNGVAARLSNAYLSGTAMQQAYAVAEAANIEFGVDDEQLFIAPRGSARQGLAPVISPKTGLKEYPVFDKDGIHLACLLNPSVQLGGLIRVESSIASATGTWRVHGLRHHLDAEHPGGKWETDIKASYVGA